jgi:hypothetical protein
MKSISAQALTMGRPAMVEPEPGVYDYDGCLLLIGRAIEIARLDAKQMSRAPALAAGAAAFLLDFGLTLSPGGGL